MAYLIKIYIYEFTKRGVQWKGRDTETIVSVVYVNKYRE